MLRAFFLIFPIFTALSLSVLSQHVHSDEQLEFEKISEKLELVDEFGRLSHCDFTGRIDTFLAELHNKSSATGYIIAYQGLDVLPAQYDEAGSERMIRNHVNFRNFDSQRLVIIRGGFRDGMRTQLWIVPAGAEPPVPTDTVPAPTIPVDRTFLFDKNYIWDETGETLQEFELPSVRAEREAEQAAMEAQYEAERAAAEAEYRDSSEGDAAIEPEIETVEELEPEEYVDERTPEEIEAARFNWVSEKFGELLKSREGTSGLIIFYADDQTYDIGALQMFIEQGKARLADAANIPASSIAVEFGGYRDSLETEFWVIPQNGEKPQPKPGERPVEEPEEVPYEDTNHILMYGSEPEGAIGSITVPLRGEWNRA